MSNPNPCAGEKTPQLINNFDQPSKDVAQAVAGVAAEKENTFLVAIKSRGDALGYVLDFSDPQDLIHLLHVDTSVDGEQRPNRTVINSNLTTMLQRCQARNR